MKIDTDGGCVELMRADDELVGVLGGMLAALGAEDILDGLLFCYLMVYDARRCGE